MLAFSHPHCLAHDPGTGHPESPARLRAVLDRLDRNPAFQITSSGPASREAILRVHPASYLDHLATVAGDGGGSLDQDTVMGPARGPGHGILPARQRRHRRPARTRGGV